MTKRALFAMAALAAAAAWGDSLLDETLGPDPLGPGERPSWSVSPPSVPLPRRPAATEPDVPAALQGGSPTHPPMVGFIVGCCFGVRSGAAFNDGKTLHWKDWGIAVPLAGIAVAVLNGVDAMNGMGEAELAAQYGSQYY